MKIVILVIFSFFALVTSAQLTTSGGQTPNQLVQNVLLGPGVDVSNVFFSGSPGAIGTFNGMNTTIGIDEGIIMTTGTIANTSDGPHGPNNSASAGLDNGISGYGQLTNLVGTSTYNAAILEFDFIPYSDTVKFEYVFASEEYPEFVGSQFNDVFAFFISGPGIPGGTQNMALLPGTTQPVAINNVNNGPSNSGPCTNCSYYVNNGTGSNAPYNSNAQYVQYDGFTTPLKAVSKVECGKMYHLIIAIADVGDGIYDSGIFLAANSLTSEQPVSVSHTLSSDPYGDGVTMAQGCTSATVTVTRSGNMINQPLTIPINVTGTSVEGLDHSSIPNSVTFAAGQTSVSFTINALNNPGLTGTVNILMEFEIPDPCGQNNFQTIELFIRPVDDVEVDVNDVTVLCPGETVVLNATATGGGGGYTYLWSTGETTQSISVSPNSTQTYSVEVTDACLNQTAQNSGTVTVPVYDNLLIDASDDIVEQCPYVPFTLEVEVTGGAGNYTYVWTNPAGQTLSNSNTVNVVPSQTTTYTVVVTDQCGNSETDQVTITILSPPLLLDISPSQEICPGDSAYIEVNATGGFGNYYYYWPHSGETTAGIWVSPLATSSYEVIVMDDCQTFQVTAETEVVVIQPDANFRVITDPLYINLPITFQNLTHNGNTYEWSFGDGSTSTMTHPNNTYSTPGSYDITLIATDVKGCKDTTVRTIIILDEFYLYVPNTFTPDNDRFNNTFKISSVNLIDFEIRIFNRWGEVVFESQDKNFEWDGTYNGEVVRDGTYVWQIYYRSINDDEEKISGHINVLR
ncbi:MAG: choice-of-anchor L domain-containing protein [Brumimicrobium sp.]|nr:choice-of-anchor L domain-containing protein [Brumimicrobium sp.]